MSECLKYGFLLWMADHPPNDGNIFRFTFGRFTEVFYHFRKSVCFIRFEALFGVRGKNVSTINVSYVWRRLLASLSQREHGGAWASTPVLTNFHWFCAHTITLELRTVDYCRYSHLYRLFFLWLNESRKKHFSPSYQIDSIFAVSVRLRSQP